MTTYKIGDKTIQLDETKLCLDFMLNGEKIEITRCNFAGLMEAIQAGKISVDEDLLGYMKLLSRWVTDGPRKRNLRKMKMDMQSGKMPGVFGSNEVLFEQLPEDKAEELFVGFENTGAFAAHFLEAFGRGPFIYPPTKTSVFVGTGDGMTRITPEGGI